MAPYSIRFKSSVRKDLRKIREEDVHRILKKINELSADPYAFGSKKLKGKELHRIRVGVYRVIYEIHDDQLIVCVVKVGHRKQVYKA